MSLVRTFVHHPRKLWLRMALFQIHPWVGILLSLYIVTIALTGSILVFREESRKDLDGMAHRMWETSAMRLR